MQIPCRVHRDPSTPFPIGPRFTTRASLSFGRLTPINTRLRCIFLGCKGKRERLRQHLSALLPTDFNNYSYLYLSAILHCRTYVSIYIRYKIHPRYRYVNGVELRPRAGSPVFVLREYRQPHWRNRVWYSETAARSSGTPNYDSSSAFNAANTDYPYGKNTPSDRIRFFRVVSALVPAASCPGSLFFWNISNF